MDYYKKYLKYKQKYLEQKNKYTTLYGGNELNTSYSSNKKFKVGNNNIQFRYIENENNSAITDDNNSNRKKRGFSLISPEELSNKVIVNLNYENTITSIQIDYQKDLNESELISYIYMYLNENRLYQCSHLAYNNTTNTYTATMGNNTEYLLLEKFRDSQKKVFTGPVPVAIPSNSMIKIVSKDNDKLNFYKLLNYFSTKPDDYYPIIIFTIDNKPLINYIRTNQIIQHMLKVKFVIDNNTKVKDFIDLLTKNFCLQKIKDPNYYLDGYKFVDLVRGRKLDPDQDPDRTFGNYENELKPEGSIKGPGPTPNSIVSYKNYFYVNFI